MKLRALYVRGWISGLVLWLSLPIAVQIAWAGKNTDYYAVLGVSRNATEQELKDAQRKLLRQYHPDRNPGDKRAEEKAKEVNEAYQVLSDPQKRAKYDAGPAQNKSHESSVSPADPVTSWAAYHDDILSRIHGMWGEWGITARDAAMEFALKPSEAGGLGMDIKSAEAFASNFKYRTRQLRAGGYTINTHYDEVFRDLTKSMFFARKPAARGGLGLDEEAARKWIIDAAMKPYPNWYAKWYQDSFEFASKPLSDGGQGLNREASIQFAEHVVKQKYPSFYLEDYERSFVRHLKKAQVSEENKETVRHQADRAARAACLRRCIIGF